MYLSEVLDREELRVRVVMVRLALGDDGGGGGGSDVHAVIPVTGACRGRGFHLPMRRVSDACHLVAHPALRTAGETIPRLAPTAPSA